MNSDLEKEIKDEWLSWGEPKPWYCPKCDLLLSIKYHSSCSGGSHPYKPFGLYPYHEEIIPKRSVTFQEFCTIKYRMIADWMHP